MSFGILQISLFFGIFVIAGWCILFAAAAFVDNGFTHHALAVTMHPNHLGQLAAIRTNHDVFTEFHTQQILRFSVNAEMCRKKNSSGAVPQLTADNKNFYQTHKPDSVWVLSFIWSRRRRRDLCCLPAGDLREQRCFYSGIFGIVTRKVYPGNNVYHFAGALPPVFNISLKRKLQGFSASELLFSVATLLPDKARTICLGGAVPVLSDFPSA